VSATPSTISAAPNGTGTRGYRSEPKVQSGGAHSGGASAIGKQSKVLLIGGNILTHTPDRPTHERLDIRVEVLVAMRLVFSGACVGNALSESSRRYRQTIHPDRIGPIAIVR
jgi:hypothetical protein